MVARCTSLARLHEWAPPGNKGWTCVSSGLCGPVAAPAFLSVGRTRSVFFARGAVTLSDSALETKVGPAFPERCAGQECLPAVQLSDRAPETKVGPAFPPRCAGQKRVARGRH